MTNNLTFEGFSLKETAKVLAETQTVKPKELNGTHINTAPIYNLPTQENNAEKDSQIQQLQTTVETLIAHIQNQDHAKLLEEFRKIQAEKQPTEAQIPAEVIDTLKTMQLFQAKVVQKLELLLRTQTPQKTTNTWQDGTSDKLQTHSLYLSKIEQKLELLSRTQQQQQIAQVKLQTQTQGETNERLQTQALYLAKMEQKIEIVQRTLQKWHILQEKDDTSSKLQTNNLYLAKIEQKLELIGRIQQKQAVPTILPKNEETNERLQTNNLYLAKIEQKLELISRTQHKNNAPQPIKQEAEPETHQILIDKLATYQNTLNNIGENIQNLQQSETKISNELLIEEISTLLQEKFEALVPAIAQPTLASILPTPDFWDKLHLIMERNETQIKEIRQVIEAITRPANPQEQPASSDDIMSGLHTNNLYLSKMEQRLESLNKTLERVIQKKA